jgi:hypothetical protein
MVNELRTEFPRQRGNSTRATEPRRRHREEQALFLTFAFRPQIKESISTSEILQQFFECLVFTLDGKRARVLIQHSPPFTEHILCLSCVRLRILGLRRDHFSAKIC